MLSAETIATVKATIPALTQHGELLTRHFYRRLFDGNPEVRAFFNPAHQHSGGQQRALAAAICAYAQHIENPAALAGAVELIGHKHASLGVRPEHYPVVGEHLLASIREVLGAAATDEVIRAWGEAYQFLAGVLIGREAEMYDDHRDEHGWQGLDTFVVRRKRRESDTITSFYLGRADGAPLRPFRAGQYVTVRVPAAGGGTTMRNYSLSGAPGAAEYRISVKREPAAAAAAPAGHVSNYLHDHVGEGDRIEVGPPCGEFVLRAAPAGERRPLVLISGGVGVTPLLAMLHAALAADDGREIWFIHGAVNGGTHAFGDEVRSLAAKHPRLRVHVRYCTPTPRDREAGRFDGEGLIDLPLLRALLGSPDGEFYFCGPKPFMANLYAGLLGWGVPPAQLRYEFFGPAEELRASAEAAVA